ncbi:acyl-CoA N-acyltransferase [Penicillium cataractarum]|uniref:Acyl-CoA N-acyltransferase n=1 Tax=Penicillium cataractarum TaxID=2100454 RepID=A0A9W9VEG7_9EURO|nr:acyl-CoA N-acyltransferase [Penicillium cataractarum]KAJ5377814.1 acyl-CoA N-acyltransferase [Penicillium cataractarum]
MNFTILPIDYDADILRIATIELACYADSDQELEKILFPYTNTNPSAEKALAGSVSRLIHDRDDPALSFVKLVDPIASEIIAYARWQFYTTDACNPDAVKDYFGRIVQAKEGLYGRAEHAHLAGICCHPAHQHRGAASALMEWGCKRADALGLVTYLEAASTGLSLYRKFGFEPIQEIDFDLSRHDTEIGIRTTVIMKRLPVGHVDV